MAIDRATGRLLAGRYELKERLGQGGMGVVWRATDVLLQRDVAVKALQIPSVLDEADHDGLRAKVLREARAAARLNHPGVVTVFDVVEDGDEPVIIMELVDSPSLAELVRRQGPLDPVRAAAIGVEVLDALVAAHANGIIHRDVKPANIMVPEHGRVRLSDFGVAALLDDPTVTTTGAVAGSPSYMAPEQATGEARGPASDLWSLGASLYFAVEGQPPFQKDGAIATLTSIVHDEPRPHVRAAELGPVLDALLVKDAAERPASEELRRLLTEVAAGGPALARPAPLATPAAPATPAPSAVPNETQGLPPTLPAGAPPADPTAAPAPPVPPPPFRPAPPSPPATTSAGNNRGRRRLAVPLLLLATLAVGAIVIALVAMNTNDPPSTSSPTATSAPTPAPAAGARRSPAASTTSTARRAPSSTSSTAAVAAPASAPAGWVGYTDPGTGFSISRPSGWGVRTRGTLTDFTDPASGAYLRVDHVEPPGPSPEGAWHDYEPKFAAGKAGYQRIQITPTTFKGFDAAIWEFTYGAGAGARHAVDLGFVTGRYGFALNFQTPSADWERLQPVFENFKASFEAPRS